MYHIMYYAQLWTERNNFHIISNRNTYELKYFKGLQYEFNILTVMNIQPSNFKLANI